MSVILGIVDFVRKFARYVWVLWGEDGTFAGQSFKFLSRISRSRGVIAAVTTTCVMVWATVLLIEEARRRTRPSTRLVERAGDEGDRTVRLN